MMEYMIKCIRNIIYFSSMKHKGMIVDTSAHILNTSVKVYLRRS